MQVISIPGLKGSVHVDMGAMFKWDVALRSGSTNFDPAYDAQFLLAEQNKTANLDISAHLWFPNAARDDNYGYKNDPYTQTVSRQFTHIKLADGELTGPANNEIILQGEPSPPGSAQSKFRFLGGKAVWLTSPNNPRIYVVKIAIVVGSPDVIVRNWSSEDKDKEWKFGIGGGDDAKKGGKPKKAGVASDVWDGVTGAGKWVADKASKLIPEFELSGGGGSRTKGVSQTVGDMTQTREWTLALVLPEPKPKPAPPGPFSLPEPYKIYFDTGKSNADTYRSALSGNMDQRKGLREHMAQIEKMYGLENIVSVKIKGYASGLGDFGPHGSKPNEHLSYERAKYVADILSSPLYHINIPKEHIKAEASPINSNGKDNKPEDRRAELVVMIRGGTPRRQ